MNRWVYLALGVSFVGAIWQLSNRQPGPIDLGPGVLAPDPPVQTTIAKAAPIRVGDYTLLPLAEFRVEAKLISAERYYADRGADLAPIDFALGWGRMSDRNIIDQLNVSQGARFFTYRWEHAPPIPFEEITRSSTNTHLIPANEAIRRQLFRMAPGSVMNSKACWSAPTAPTVSCGTRRCLEPTMGPAPAS
jgi:hypothetical protein